MVKLTRAQIRIGVKGMDVTVKSAKGFARSFAPTWTMVMGYKNGTLTETQYTEQYMKILGAVSVEAWRWLYAQAVNDEVVLLCFCKDRQFCHTHLLIDYACRKYPKAFSKK
jgi:uncharacterized protein YeaO (DUF488 family)